MKIDRSSRKHLEVETERKYAEYYVMKSSILLHRSTHPLKYKFQSIFLCLLMRFKMSTTLNIVNITITWLRQICGYIRENREFDKKYVRQKYAKFVRDNDNVSREIERHHSWSRNHFSFLNSVSFDFIQ